MEKLRFCPKLHIFYKVVPIFFKQITFSLSFFIHIFFFGKIHQFLENIHYMLHMNYFMVHKITVESPTQLIEPADL